MTVAITASFLFLRHGESTWNAARRWQGRADAPLSERGETQARAAGAALIARGPFDGVVTSSLQRARRTGELIAATTGIALEDGHDGLAERSAGEWEGLTRVEIEAKYPGFLDSGDRPDGYETDVSVVQRALAVIDQLARATPSRRSVVVSHGGVIHALERHVSGDDGRWQRLDNLEGRWFEYRDGRLLTRGERVSLLVGEHRVPSLDEGYA